jgi:hypothetical protein
MQDEASNGQWSDDDPAADTLRQVMLRELSAVPSGRSPCAIRCSPGPGCVPRLSGRGCPWAASVLEVLGEGRG